MGDAIGREFGDEILAVNASKTVQVHQCGRFFILSLIGSLLLQTDLTAFSQVIQDMDNKQPDVTFCDNTIRLIDAGLRDDFFPIKWTHPDEMDKQEVKK